MTLIPLPKIPRQHGLDALRAFAMLLGIALHGALSFAGFPWIVQDLRPDPSFGLLFTLIHSFRMQLFMLLSGYFTMMLWRKRGLNSLLKQRFWRLFLPCMIGLVTVIPAMEWASGVAGQWSAKQDLHKRTTSAGRSEIVEAIRKGDLEEIGRLIQSGHDVNQIDPQFQNPPLVWAARYGNPKVAQLLLDRGADVLFQAKDGYSALHSAAFLGHFRMVELLIERGANANALGQKNDTALDTTRADKGTTTVIANILGVPLRPEDEIEAEREECRQFLSHYTKEKNGGNLAKPNGFLLAGLDGIRKGYADFLTSERLLWKGNGQREPFHLILTPVFHHLWFLWFLCWFVGFFAIIVLVGKVLPVGKFPPTLILTQARWLWIFPATMVPQLLMGIFSPGIGPDTSTGLIPQPHLLVFYGIFFAFGAFYYDCDDRDGQLAKYWRWSLPLGLFVFLPLARATLGQVVVSGCFQVICAWAISFGCIGLCNRYLTKENKTIRYLSDSAYWLYLAHLPLIILLQAWVRDWDIPAFPKFVFVCSLCTILLLVSYQFLVRYSFIGLLLNGPRSRSKDAP